MKACVAAATTDWLPETLGVRSSKTDAVVELKLESGATGVRSKNRIGGAVGVACEVEKVFYGSHLEYNKSCCSLLFDTKTCSMSLMRDFFP